jgi:hypothetical protein
MADPVKDLPGGKDELWETSETVKNFKPSDR